MSIVDRAALAPGAWNDYVAAHPRGGFWHHEDWLDYCLAYAPQSRDHSFAILQRKKVIAVVPLIQEGRAFTMGGHPGAEPLLSTDDIALQRTVVQNLRQRAALAQVTRWTIRSMPQPTPTVPVNYGRVGWRDLSWSSYVIDLTQPQDALWRAVRRSYHSLVHRAEDDYNLTIHTTALAVGVAHRIHAAAAERETRPQATWDLMAQWAQKQQLYVLIAKNSANEARGMAMAIRYKHWAYYASAAQLDMSLTHAMVWRLAMALKGEGVRIFEVGWGEREHDTPKEQQIAFFRRGFGGAPWTIQAGEVML